MRYIDEIIIHCAATRPDWMDGQSVKDKVAEIRKWHKGRGWSDIGYHYVIDRDGQIAPGRPLEKTGAHVRGHNTGSIGVCLIGGHGSSENDAFSDNYTMAQEHALRLFLRDMQVRIPSITKITGHNRYAAKACPGFNVQRWLENKSPERKRPIESKMVQLSTAQIGGGAGAAWAAFNSLEGAERLIALGFAGFMVLAAVWFFRDRIQKFAKGVR